MRVASTRICIENTMTTKRWAPFGPLDEFDVADATLPISYVLATRGATGGTPGGGIEGVVRALLIVELGSLGFFGKHDGGAVGRNWVPAVISFLVFFFFS